MVSLDRERKREKRRERSEREKKKIVNDTFRAVMTEVINGSDFFVNDSKYLITAFRRQEKMSVSTPRKSERQVVETNKSYKHGTGV